MQSTVNMQAISKNHFVFLDHERPNQENDLHMVHEDTTPLEKDDQHMVPESSIDHMAMS